MDKKYDCAGCANRRSPLCELCTQVTAPDGTESKPKYYIELEAVVPLFAKRELSDRGEECALMIEKHLNARCALPVSLVMEYNSHVESAGFRGESLKHEAAGCVEHVEN